MSGYLRRLLAVHQKAASLVHPARGGLFGPARAAPEWTLRPAALQAGGAPMGSSDGLPLAEESGAAWRPDGAPAVTTANPVLPVSEREPAQLDTRGDTGKSGESGLLPSAESQSASIRTAVRHKAKPAQPETAHRPAVPVASGVPVSAPSAQDTAEHNPSVAPVAPRLASAARTELTELAKRMFDVTRPDTANPAQGTSSLTTLREPAEAATPAAAGRLGVPTIRPQSGEAPADPGTLGVAASDASSATALAEGRQLAAARRLIQARSALGHRDASGTPISPIERTSAAGPLDAEHTVQAGAAAQARRGGRQSVQPRSADAEAVTVQVAIGILEIRATVAGASAAPRATASPRPGPRMSLDAYLRERTGGAQR